MMNARTARIVALGPLLAGSMALGGCMSSPTYGTDKTSTEQLVEDVTGVLSLGPKPRPKIEYSPRPELVKPASTEALPAPQENIVAADSQAWPESPEQQRARVRQYANENRDKQGFEPIVVSDNPVAPVKRQEPGVSARSQDSGVFDGVTKEQTATYKKLVADNQQGNPTQRKYLSEPPLDYRQPEATAATNDLGEDEYKKERRRKAAATKSNGLSDWIPDIF